MTVLPMEITNRCAKATTRLRTMFQFGSLQDAIKASLASQTLVRAPADGAGAPTLLRASCGQTEQASPSVQGAGATLFFIRRWATH